MRIGAALGIVLFAALLLLAGPVRAVDLTGLPDSEPVTTPMSPPAEPGTPTPRPESKEPDEPRVIRDPLPPAVWSGGSMLALGGAYAAFRRLRKRLASSGFRI